jgi:putative transposase
MSDHIEQKILSLYTLGNSYSQISEHIQELYGIEFSKATISTVTDKVIPLLKEWQQRPLESIYPFVWLDAIHYKIKGAFPNENSLLKLLYMGIQNASKNGLYL